MTTVQDLIFTNNDESNLKSILSDFANKANRIRVATAFFSDTEFIIDWLDNLKQVDLLVSLRPPTNYYSLKTVQPKLGINIQFLGKEFHSKFFIFYNQEKPFACIIGSSNFTSGGLHRNIETNAILTASNYLSEIENHFDTLWEKSFLLQPTDLTEFKKIYDAWQNRNQKSGEEQDDFENRTLSKRIIKRKKAKVGKEAKEYFAFWRVIDEVRETVKDISEKEFPNVPVYLSIDHFWHWVKTVWGKEKRPKPSVANRQVAIRKLFQEYCDWDKNRNNYTTQMGKTSENLFGKLLSVNHIDELTKDEAGEIYANLHSGAMRTRRFGADKKFVQDNSIQKIRASLKYLLYSNDELDLRIHNLCLNPAYKLNQLKSSGTQEIIGWVTPDKYPIRNDKADDALKMLGFTLNETAE